MSDELSKGEIRKDAIQDSVTAAAATVGAVTTILTNAVGDVARALGGFATEVFEIRDSTRRALRDQEAADALPEAGHEGGRPTIRAVESPPDVSA